MNGGNVPPAKTMFLIRIALVSGVAIFALIALWTRRDAATAASAAEMLGTMRWGVFGISIAAIGVALIMRGKRAGQNEAQQRQSTIIGWAPGEAAALFGIVQYLQGGSAATMAIGVLAFAAALILLPIPGTQR